MTSERIRKALISAVQKQIPKTIQPYIVWDEIVGECPSCYCIIRRNTIYCPYCGQKLKWGILPRELSHTETKANLTPTVTKELNLESPCDTIQVENASNDNPNKVEVAVPDDWYGETNIVL